MDAYAALWVKEVEPALRETPFASANWRDAFSKDDHYNNTANMPALEIRHGVDGAGWYTTENIKKGEKIVESKLDGPSVMITPQAGEATSISRACREAKGFKKTSVINLALFLVEDMRSPKTQFQVYYRSLPKDFSLFPQFMSPPTMRRFEGSLALKQIMEDITEWVHEFKAIKDCGKAAADFTLSEWLYVRAAVLSRNFMNAVITAPVLLPFWDMFNHASPPKMQNAEMSFEAEFLTNGDLGSVFLVKAVHAIPKGSQIYVSYGDSSHEPQFFTNYGFLDSTLENMSYACEGAKPLKALSAPLVEFKFKLDQGETRTMAVSYTSIHDLLEALMWDIGNRVSGPTLPQSLATGILRLVLAMKRVNALASQKLDAYAPPSSTAEVSISERLILLEKTFLHAIRIANDVFVSHLQKLACSSKLSTEERRIAIVAVRSELTNKAGLEYLPPCGVEVLVGTFRKLIEILEGISDSLADAKDRLLKPHFRGTH